MSNTNEFDQQGEEALNRSRERQEREEKICPFLSTPSSPTACNPKCKLYRKEHRNNECMFFEMRSISWNTSKKGSPVR